MDEKPIKIRRTFRKNLAFARQFFSLVMGGLSFVVVDQVGRWLCPAMAWSPQCTQITQSMINTAVWAAPILGYSFTIITLKFSKRWRFNRAAAIEIDDDSIS